MYRVMKQNKVVHKGSMKGCAAFMLRNAHVNPAVLLQVRLQWELSI